VRLRSLQERVRKQLPPLVVIQEAGLEGFWIHRVLTENGIESHVVDPASVVTSRRRRRAKTDKLDGDTLVRKRSADPIFFGVGGGGIVGAVGGSETCRFQSIVTCLVAQI
jgi:hypothetical protein